MHLLLKLTMLIKLLSFRVSGIVPSSFRLKSERNKTLRDIKLGIAILNSRKSSSVKLRFKIPKANSDYRIFPLLKIGKCKIIIWTTVWCPNVLGTLTTWWSQLVAKNQVLHPIRHFRNLINLVLLAESVEFKMKH